jgi:hypothetical protein
MHINNLICDIRHTGRTHDRVHRRGHAIGAEGGGLTYQAGPATYRQG